MILSTVNDLIELGVKIVDTKQIRRFNNIKSNDRCKVNFIWRGLKYLEFLGHIKLIENTKPKQYKLPKKKIEKIEVI